MIEVEIKASLTDLSPEALEELARSKGFVPKGALKMTDVYYNGTDRNFAKTDEALRLRSVLEEGRGPEETFITYKGPKTDSRSNTRTEHETQIGDLAVMRQILTSLGYAEVLAVEKTRREWVRGDITLCVDRVKGLDPHMELETLVPEESLKQAAVDRLLSLLDELAVSRDNLTRKSYLEMLLAKK